MKNYFKIVFVMLITFCAFNIEIVKADYNGTGGGSVPGVGTCSPRFKYPCTWDNTHFTAVQIELIYYDGTNWNKIGNPVYIVNSTKYKDLLEKSGNKVIYNLNINTCKKDKAGPYEPCYYDDAWLKEYYTGKDGKEHSLELLDDMGVNPASLTLPSDSKINYNSQGYRFLIEPIWQFALPKTGALKLMTIKEVFRKYGGTSNPDRWANQSTLLSTDLDDIGITAHQKNQTNDVSLIADQRHGYGYNIINPPEKIFNSCYKFVTKANPGQLKCTNTNKGNKINFYETFEKTDCDSGEKVENASQYGRLVKQVNSDCKIYCRETVEMELPGNVLPAVNVGRYFIWPSFGTSINDKHQLNIVGRRLCTKVGNSCGGYTPNIDELYDNFETNIKIKYNDKEYKFDSETLDIKSSTGHVYTKDEYYNLTGYKYDEDLIAERKVSLKLPDELYRYYNTSTKKYSSKKTGNDEDIITYNNGILPVSLNETITGKKTMQLYDFKIGSKGIFNSVANDALSDYVCNYEVTNDKPAPCICPPGTEHAGEDLWCKVANSGGENCPTEIEKYCNDVTLDPTDLICEDKPKYCPEPYQHISVEKCVNAGNTYQSCVDKYCTGNPPEYECPRNKDDGTTEWMDITGCVEGMIAKGFSESQAINYCKDIVCPSGENPEGGNLNIIYRTISLRNPFPSKDLKAGITGFNLDVNGRYPGANWNSRDLVKAKILNNRGLSNPQDVYSKKEPLYKIVLTPANTRAIINYNRSRLKYGGYQDFNLKCYGKNINGQKDGSECLSEFLKDPSGAYGVDKNASACYQKTGSEFEGCRY